MVHINTHISVAITKFLAHQSKVFSKKRKSRGSRENKNHSIKLLLAENKETVLANDKKENIPGLGQVTEMIFLQIFSKQRLRPLTGFR